MPLLFLISLAGLSWLGLQAVHELGHVLGGLLTGGTVTEVDLHPLHISHTAVDPNPFPLAVIWAGPVFGSVAPLLMWFVARRFWPRAQHGFQFFAGFCLIGNGAYLGSAVYEPVGDAFDLLRAGAPLWQLALFGLVCVPAGVWLWDGLSKPFGLKRGAPGPGRAAALGLFATLVGVTVVEWLVFRRFFQ